MPPAPWQFGKEQSRMLGGVGATLVPAQTTTANERLGSCEDTLGFTPRVPRKSEGPVRPLRALSVGVQPAECVVTPAPVTRQQRQIRGQVGRVMSVPSTPLAVSQI